MQGKKGLRLDAQKGNQKLNQYYQRLGYTFVEELVEGEYVGNKLEKVFVEKKELAYV